MSQVIDWVEKTNQEIIELVIDALESNKSTLTVFNKVKEFELTPFEIDEMIKKDIDEVLSKWNKYYEYGTIPVSQPRYAKTSNLLKSRTSIVSQSLAIGSSNSFANLNGQLFNMVEKGNMGRKQAISILRKKYQGNVITYANGNDVPIVKYLNMVFSTELGNVTRERAFETGEYLGTTVYQMSSFSDSAERCIYAQGGYINFGLGDTTVQFKDGGRLKSFEVRDVVLHDRYGQADALGGIGCRHTWVPRIPGFSTTSSIVQNTDYFTGL